MKKVIALLFMSSLLLSITAHADQKKSPDVSGSGQGSSQINSTKPDTSAWNAGYGQKSIDATESRATYKELNQTIQKAVKPCKATQEKCNF